MPFVFNSSFERFSDSDFFSKLCWARKAFKTALIEQIEHRRLGGSLTAWQSQNSLLMFNIKFYWQHNLNVHLSLNFGLRQLKYFALDNKDSGFNYFLVTRIKAAINLFRVFVRSKSRFAVSRQYFNLNQAVTVKL